MKTPGLLLAVLALCCAANMVSLAEEPELPNADEAGVVSNGH